MRLQTVARDFSTNVCARCATTQTSLVRASKRRARCVILAPFSNAPINFSEIVTRMNRIKLALSLAAAALFVVACNSNTATNTNIGSSGNRTVTANTANANAAPAANANNDALAAARTTYNNACAKCHQPNGEGGTVNIDGEKLRVPGFKGGHALKHSDADYAKKITEGGDGMPKFKDKLTPEQINGLVRFIRAEFQTGLNVGGASNTNANK
jgi:mono/diheme cytochrome c family protein